MNDFYVYYEPKPNDITKGIIKGIAPHEISDFEGMEFIRIPFEQGLTFTTGDEPLSRWMVAWDNDELEMVLAKTEPEEVNNIEISFLAEVPKRQTKPQLSITYHREKNEFHLLTRGVSISHQNLNMVFFVTRQGDPNILLHHFKTTLYETMRRGITIPCEVELPEKFSVFAKPELERYKLKVQR